MNVDLVLGSHRLRPGAAIDQKNFREMLKPKYQVSLEMPPRAICPKVVPMQFEKLACIVSGRKPKRGVASARRYTVGRTRSRALMPRMKVLLSAVDPAN